MGLLLLLNSHPQGFFSSEQHRHLTSRQVVSTLRLVADCLCENAQCPWVRRPDSVSTGAENGGRQTGADRCVLPFSIWGWYLNAILAATSITQPNLQMNRQQSSCSVGKSKNFPFSPITRLPEFLFLFLVPREDLNLHKYVLIIEFHFGIFLKNQVTVIYNKFYTTSSKLQNKLTHRTCRATAPSARSLCVNRSVGNSCSAERDGHQQLGHFIYSKRMKKQREKRGGGHWEDKAKAKRREHTKTWERDIWGKASGNESKGGRIGGWIFLHLGNAERGGGKTE